MNDLAARDMEEHQRALSLLKNSHNRMSGELRIARKEHDKISGSVRVPEGLVGKLRKMDRLKQELEGLRAANVQMNVIIASLSAKTSVFQDRLFDLRNDREGVQKEYSEVQKNRDWFVNLRSKVLPEPKLVEYRNWLKKESAALREISEEVGRLKGTVPLLVEEAESLKEKLAKTIERIPITQERIASTKEKIERLAPKVVSEEEVKKLEDEVHVLRPRKKALAEESKELSPRVASIAEEEEGLPSVLEAYKSKNQKDEARLSEIKKELDQMDVDEDVVAKLREKASSMEGEYEVKKMELEKLKEEHSELVSSNQKYKATIEEVETGTQRLKDLMKNGSSPD